VASSSSENLDNLLKSNPLSTPTQQETKNKYFNQESLSKISKEFFVTDSTFSDTEGIFKVAESSDNLFEEVDDALFSNVSTNIVTAEPQDSGYYVYKKEETATAPITQTKNLFGANLDVVGKLDKIVFEEYGDGSLRNSIAYIVPWSRGESPIKTQTPPSYAEAFGQGRDNFLADTEFSFGTNFGVNDSDLPISFPKDLDISSIPPLSSVPTWSAENATWEGTTLNSSSFSTVIDQKGKAPSSGTTDIESRQKKLGSEIPVGIRQGLAFGDEVLTGFVKKENTQIGKFLETGVSQVAKALDTPSGPIYVGNASGLVSQALDYATLFGFNIPGRGLTTSIKPDLQSNRSKWNGGVISEGGAAGVPQGAWQFLFNPNQLSLNIGPKYKETSAWGVAGDANGGKPLHWTSNKNPQLKFSKVLLNGYVFGRQVESLEQGLIELFMKNPSGNSSHGPQVLEFVWGQRTFGPCVIKDIQIEEKMWDNGLLVNADVSFTLEKIPEWTINDGQVSVYDSSTIDPLVTPEATPNNTPPSEPDSKEKTQPQDLGVKIAESIYSQKECNTGRYTAKNFETLFNDPRLSPNILQKIRGSDDAAAISAANKYVTIYNSYSSVINTLSGLDPQCRNKCSYIGQAAPSNNTVIGCAKSCSKQISTLLNQRYSGTKCPFPTVLRG
jgi:hypothetical protein